MAANDARGQDANHPDPGAGRPGLSGPQTRIADWLRDQDTPPAPRRMDPPASAEMPHSPALNRLTAQFDRIRAQAAARDDASSLAEVLERRTAARSSRDAETPVHSPDEALQSTDEINATLHAAIADIISRQRALDPADAERPRDSVDVYFGIEPPPPAPELVTQVILPSEDAPPPGLNLRGFFARLDDAGHAASAPEPATLATMDSAVDRLAAQFEATANRGFETLENCHAEIMRTIRESRAMSVEAAEAAAARTIDSSLETIGGTLAGRFEDLARDIAELKSHSNDGERRTCDMLQAVRETLEIVAERLPQRSAAPAEPAPSSLLDRVRAAGQQPPKPAAAPERSRFIAAARRSADADRAPEVQVAEPRAPQVAPNAAAPRRAPAPKRQPSPATNAAKAQFRRRLMIGAAAATLLLGSYGGAMVLLDRNLAREDSARLPVSDTEIAALAPESAAGFSTTEAGAPASYRPTEPIALDSVQPIPSEIVPPAPSAVPPAPAEPAITGSITRNGASDAALPAELHGALLRRRASVGDPSALYETGLRLAEGRGISRDPAKAAIFLGRAASAGIVPAQYLLGSLKEKGAGVPKDIPGARRLYEQAAASGNVQAMHNLGVLHAEGGLGQPDMAAAADWFGRAADLGLKDSQFNLGIIKARGLAGQPDMAEAYMWLAIAARSGDKDAAAKRDQIGAKLSAEQLKAAKQRAAQWQPLPVNAKANEVAAPPEGWDGAETGRASTRERAPKVAAAR